MVKILNVLVDIFRFMALLFFSAIDLIVIFGIYFVVGMDSNRIKSDWLIEEVFDTGLPEKDKQGILKWTTSLMLFILVLIILTKLIYVMISKI